MSNASARPWANRAQNTNVEMRRCYATRPRLAHHRSLHGASPRRGPEDAQARRDESHQLLSRRALSTVVAGGHLHGGHDVCGRYALGGHRYYRQQRSIRKLAVATRHGYSRGRLYRLCRQLEPIRCSHGCRTDPTALLRRLRIDVAPVPNSVTTPEQLRHSRLGAARHGQNCVAVFPLGTVVAHAHAVAHAPVATGDGARFPFRRFDDCRPLVDCWLLL